MHFDKKIFVIKLERKLMFKVLVEYSAHFDVHTSVQKF